LENIPKAKAGLDVAAPVIEEMPFCFKQFE
jgi:hypothetical protein